jgi:hypothetical protein
MIFIVFALNAEPLSLQVELGMAERHLLYLISFFPDNQNPKIYGRAHIVLEG